MKNFLNKLTHSFSGYIQSRLQITLQILTFYTFLDTIFVDRQTLIRLLVTTQIQPSYFQLFAQV